MEKIKEKTKTSLKKMNIKNKIQKNIVKISLSKFLSFTSILIIFIALALSSYAATVRVQSGNLNISNDLSVNSNTLFVDSTNNKVGIGTTTPRTLFHLVDSLGADFDFIINSTISTGRNAIKFGQAGIDGFKVGMTGSNNFIIRDNVNTDIVTVEPSGAANTLYLDNAGIIGMGTASPVANLHILGTSTNRIRLIVDDNDGTPGRNVINFTRKDNVAVADRLQTNALLMLTEHQANYPFVVRDQAGASLLYLFGDGSFNLENQLIYMLFQHICLNTYRS